MLNEIIVKGAERVELHNSGPGIVDVNGWTVESGGGSHVLGGIAPLLPGSYEVIDVPGNIFTDNGGFIELLDDGAGSQDGVYYGQFGSAPLPPADGLLAASVVAPSLARAPDGSVYSTPPPASPGTDGTIWTLDFSPTWGAVNDAPTPVPGSTVLLNEVDPKPAGGLDMVELYNPFAVAVAVDGWLLVNGAAVMSLSGSVPGGGFLAITTDPGFDVETEQLLYLFDGSGVRVDQLGFHLPPVRGTPPLDVCQCHARFPDGAGPNLGYDWWSSGGFVTLFPLVCTPGSANQFVTDCGTVSVEARPTETWGRVKAMWR
jgi:hypothetical protein